MVRQSLGSSCPCSSFSASSGTISNGPATQPTDSVGLQSFFTNTIYVGAFSPTMANAAACTSKDSNVVESSREGHAASRPTPDSMQGRATPSVWFDGSTRRWKTLQIMGPSRHANVKSCGTDLRCFTTTDVDMYMEAEVRAGPVFCPVDGSRRRTMAAASVFSPIGGCLPPD
jgi:hypothetical protein